ncbi:MAG: histidine phosphatase family protein [Chloroflexota bacterium]
MTTILLIRHGENDMMKKGRLAGRTPGVHLNDEGRAHAQLLADVLAPKLAQAREEGKLRGIFSSPMERTQETAAPLAAALGQPIVIRPGLIETDCGSWSGKTLKGLSRLKLWRTVQQSPSLFCFPGGESFTDIQQRIVGEIEVLRSGFTDAKDLALCFSHADPIKLAVAYYLNMPLDAFQRLVINPTSITGLFFEGEAVRLLMLNQGLPEKA